MHVYHGLERLTGNPLEPHQVFIALLISQKPGTTARLVASIPIPPGYRDTPHKATKHAIKRITRILFMSGQALIVDSAKLTLRARLVRRVIRVIKRVARLMIREILLVARSMIREILLIARSMIREILLIARSMIREILLVARSMIREILLVARSMIRFVGRKIREILLIRGHRLGSWDVRFAKSS